MDFLRSSRWKKSRCITPRPRSSLAPPTKVIETSIRIRAVEARLFVAVGLLGGFTTFSSFLGRCGSALGKGGVCGMRTVHGRLRGAIDRRPVSWVVSGPAVGGLELGD